jgi:Protein of unknown function (DUF3105)
MGRSRHVEWPMVLAAGAAIVLAALGAWIFWLRGGEHARPGARVSRAAAPSRGCVFAVSPYGYPTSFVKQRIAYRRHPPLPQPGWHDETNSLEFRVLFHSVFHGYAVVQYVPDLNERTRALLKGWVAAHASDRVSATPSPASAPFAVEVAEWGHELRCATAGDLTAQMLDRFLDLRGS